MPQFHVIVMITGAIKLTPTFTSLTCHHVQCNTHLMDLPYHSNMWEKQQRRVGRHSQIRGNILLSKAHFPHFSFSLFSQLRTTLLVVPYQRDPASVAILSCFQSEHLVRAQSPASRFHVRKVIFASSGTAP